MDFLLWGICVFVGISIGISIGKSEVTKEDWERVNKVCEVVSMSDDSFTCANGTKGKLEDVK